MRTGGDVGGLCVPGGGAPRLPLPGGPARGPAAGGVLQHEGPRHDRDHSEQRPGSEPGAPTAAQHAGHGDGDGCGARRAERESHRVQARHRADAVGEPALDDHRHQDVAHRDARQREGAGGEEGDGAAGEGPQSQPGGDRDHAREHHGRGAAAARETWRQAPEQREAQRRYGGQEPGDDTAHAEVGPYLLQQRAEGGDGGTEVEGGEEHADHEEAEDPARRVRGGCRRGRRGTVGALQAVFRHLHGVHHRIMG